MKTTIAILCTTSTFLLPALTASGEQASDLSLPFLLCARVRSAPQIDGKLDDACWHGAIELGPFAKATKGGLPVEQTKGYLLYDDENLYVGVECREALLNPVLQRTHEVKMAAKTRDSEVWADDCVEVFVQPRPDREVYYHLAVNPVGTLYDARCDGGRFDTKWNASARVAASADDDAWKVEVAIPLADLGAHVEPGDTWRFNLCRV